MKVVAEFKECRECKVDARLMHTLVQEEIKLGNMTPGTLGCTRIDVYSNMDTNRPPIAGGRIRSARVYSDICTKCGKEYIVKIETGYVTVPANPGIAPIFS